MIVIANTTPTVFSPVSGAGRAGTRDPSRMRLIPSSQEGGRNRELENVKAPFWTMLMSVALLLVGASNGLAQPTVTTDKSDYAPGSTVSITGAGFQPGETVTCQVTNLTNPSAAGPEYDPWNVIANALGVIQTTWLVTQNELRATLQLTATGLTSRLTAQTTFTDADISATTSGNWSSASTWARSRTGTITTLSSSKSVTGSSTLFTTELAVGDVIMQADGTFIGTVAIITDNTHLTLSGDAASSSSNIAYTDQAVPTSTDAVTISGAIEVTVDTSAATCASLQLGASADNFIDLTFALGGVLTVIGNVTIGAGNGAKKDGGMNLANGGTLKVGGAFTHNGNKTASDFTAGTVEYNGGTQTILTTWAYGNLTVSQTGTKTLGSVTINGNVSINSGAKLSLTSADSCAGLFFDGVRQLGGTWASSGATHNDSTRFGSTTQLTVGPSGTSTTTTVSSSANPSCFNNSVTFTATVNQSAATGTAYFYDGGTLLGTGTLSGSSPNTATFSTGSLSAGSHTITATYSGDSNYAGSTGLLSPNQQVNSNPNVSNFTSPTATTPCAGSASTVTVNSTSLGSGTYTVTYSLSGANTASGSTATLTMGASSGTFNTLALANSGSTTVTITSIQNGSGCSSAVSSGNAASVTVSPTSVGGTATATTSTVCSGSGTTITVSGYTGTTIQWQQSPNGSMGWANVSGGSGGTTATYTTPNLTQTTYYRAVVTSGVCSSANSTTATVAVSPTSVGGTATATASTVCSGSGTTITVSGYTGTTIQWQQSPNGSSGWVNISGGSGGTTATYTTPNLTQTTYYRAVVTSGVCLSANSSTASVTVSPTSVGGTATAMALTVCSGSGTTITVSGYTGTTIQWQQSPDGSTGWANVSGGSGGTTATYTTPNLTQTTYYRAVVTSGVCSSANSSVAAVTVSPFPVAPSPNVSSNLAPHASLKVEIVPLLAAWTSPGGSPLSVQIAGPSSSQGGTAFMDSNYIYYLPPTTGNPANDSIPYTVANANGCATSASLDIQFVPSGGIAQTITVSGGSVTIKFFGTPGYTYSLQRATSLSGPWTTITANSTTSPSSPQAPGKDGSFSFTDNAAPNGTAYYRSIQN